MVYLQLAIGLGVGILGLGVVLFMMNNRHQPMHERSNNYNHNFNSEYNIPHNEGRRRKKKCTKAKPGDLCPICLDILSATNMRYLICGAAVHNNCYIDLREVRSECPTCNTKCFKFNNVGDNCTICSEEMTSDTIEFMECEHALHKNCLTKYKQTWKICPLCRKSI